MSNISQLGHGSLCPYLVKKPLLCDKVVCNQQFFVQMDEGKNDGKWHLNHL